MTRIHPLTAALSVATALLAGYVGRLVVALTFGVGAATVPAAQPPIREAAHVEPPAVVARGASSTAVGEKPRAAGTVDGDAVSGHGAAAAARAVDSPMAAAAPGDGTSERRADEPVAAAPGDGASEPPADEPVAASPLGRSGSSWGSSSESSSGSSSEPLSEAPSKQPSTQPSTQPSASAPIAESFDVAVARHSGRNAAHPTTLQSTRFRFLAYRSADRFEVTVGELAGHYRASPRTWMLLLAAERAKRLPPELPDAAHASDLASDGDELTSTQCAALRRTVEDYLRGCETIRRDLWKAVQGGGAASRPDALDPRAVAAVFAGEHGVAVIPAGTDSELDRLLDDLQLAESSARSDVEFLLQ